MDTVLIVDDDKEIVKAIEIFLTAEGIKVLKAYDGKEALEILSVEKVDLILMDIMMPNLDGLEATIQIRKEKNIPIIIMSVKSEDVDKILGLNVGGDDYICKPFNPLELVARVKSQLRRYKVLGNYNNMNEDKIIANNMVLDKNTKELLVDGEIKLLTNIEYKIMELLMSNRGKVFSAEEIYEKVWQEPCYSKDTVMVHIKRIRSKIEKDRKNPKYIKVVWGIGYKVN